MKPRLLLLIPLSVAIVLNSPAQTTQGLISGRILDAYSGAPIREAQISFVSAATGITGSARTDAFGYYVLWDFLQGLRGVSLACPTASPREQTRLSSV